MKSLGNSGGNYHAKLIDPKKQPSGREDMIYHVRARFRIDTAESLLAKLSNGTIGKQQPDLAGTRQSDVITIRTTHDLFGREIHP